MRVSEVPWEDLKVGQRLLSATGQGGTIIELDDRDDCTIHIRWDYGQLSHLYHNLGQYVKTMEIK